MFVCEFVRSFAHARTRLAPRVLLTVLEGQGVSMIGIVLDVGEDERATEGNLLWERDAIAEGA